MTMKVKFIPGLVGGLSFMLLSTGAFAQQEQTLPPVTVTAKTDVTNAVTKSFEESFKDATNTQWYKLNKKYMADFMMKDQQNRALFEKNGAIIYHLTYGFEKNLPDDVRKLVKSNYVDFNITRAINVQQENRNIWVINLEDSKKLILVRVEEGALEEVGNYDKSM
jgi:hypothetical protein